MTGRTKIWKYFDLVFNSTFDPYYTTVLTDTKKNIDYSYRSKDFLINTNGRLLDFKSGNIAINASFSSASITSRAKNQI